MTTRRSVWPLRQADGAGGLLLAPRNALDAGAHDLGNEGTGVDDEAEEQRHELRQDDDAAVEVEAPSAG